MQPLSFSRHPGWEPLAYHVRCARDLSHPTKLSSSFDCRNVFVSGFFCLESTCLEIRSLKFFFSRMQEWQKKINLMWKGCNFWKHYRRRKRFKIIARTSFKLSGWFDFDIDHIDLKPILFLWTPEPNNSGFGRCNTIGAFFNLRIIYFLYKFRPKQMSYITCKT